MSENWTTENLRELFAALKSSIPKESTRVVYSQVLKYVDWETVAFPPFSAEACQKKWTEVLHKLRKTRTLTELIDEAEVNLSSNSDTKHLKRRLMKTCPQKPPVNSYQLFCRDQAPLMAGVPNKNYVHVWAQRWQDLPQKQKNNYRLRCKNLKREYAAQKKKHLDNVDENVLSKNIHKSSNLQKTLTPAQQDDYLKHKHKKCQYLDVKIAKECHKPKGLCRSSDSEDEELSSSSSSSSSSKEEGNHVDNDEEDEREEEDDDVAFVIY